MIITHRKTVWIGGVGCENVVGVIGKRDEMDFGGAEVFGATGIRVAIILPVQQMRVINPFKDGFDRTGGAGNFLRNG